MKTIHTMKTLNKQKTKTEVQDRYAIFKSHGYPLSLILSLGYVDLIGEIKFQDLSVEKRNAVIFAKEFLSVVISDAFKSKEYRNENKMIGFLRMAIEQVDKYYEDNPEVLLWHSLNTPEE